MEVPCSKVRVESSKWKCKMKINVSLDWKSLVQKGVQLERESEKESEAIIGSSIFKSESSYKVKVKKNVRQKLEVIRSKVREGRKLNLK